jgi:hypothetical protein
MLRRVEGLRTPRAPLEDVGQIIVVPASSRKCDGLFARDAWIVVEKLLQRLTTFEIVEENPDRHARAYENGSPSENVRGGVDDLL